MGRRKLWEDLIQIASASQSEPWIILGYFNVIRHQNKKEGGLINWEMHKKELNDCCKKIHMEDLTYMVSFFTWSNKVLRRENYVQAR